MTSKQLPKMLDQMKDNTWQYANQIHFIKSIQVDEENEKFTIVTNVSSFTRNFEAAAEFLKYWTPAKEMSVPVIVNPPVDREPGPETALADEIIAILKDNIQKVQADANYVKQAQTINNNVNSIINVVRTKLDFMKQVKR